MNFYSHICSITMLLRKRNQTSNCQHSLDHRESHGIQKRHLPLFHHLIPKPLTVIIINRGKLLKRWEYQNILPVSWETYMQVKKQQLEPCMEQLIHSRLRKEYDRAVCSYPVCLIHTLRTHHKKCQAGWVTSWNQDRQEKHQQPQICIWYHSSGRKWRETEEPLDEGEGRE